jgi:hypothetical protein
VQVSTYKERRKEDRKKNYEFYILFIKTRREEREGEEQ